MSIIRHREKRCADCDADISHRGNRTQRCTLCQAAHEATQERGRYREKADTISTRRILRRQGAEEFDGPDDDLVVDYSQGGEQRPRLNPSSPRQNPRHDAVTRARLAQQAAADDEPDQTTWGDLQAIRNSGRYVDFHATTGTPPAPDPLGRSVPRNRGFRGREAPMELVNPAAEGQAFGPSPVAAQRAQHAHASDRWGGRVAPPPPILSSQLAAPPTTMVTAERQAQAETQARHQHV